MGRGGHTRVRQDQGEWELVLKQVRGLVCQMATPDRPPHRSISFPVGRGQCSLDSRLNSLADDLSSLPHPADSEQLLSVPPRPVSSRTGKQPFAHNMLT